MRIKAQLAMVMNLDKCLGCHTCSIPCKNVWTNRPGAEYIWYNNVETKPGIGYPKGWENQEERRGGWMLKEDKLSLRAGGKAEKLLKIFHNPDLPQIDEYYEPWTYDYGKLIASPSSRQQPATRPKSLLTGENIDIRWGPNWEDDLAGVFATGSGDVNFDGLEREAFLRFQNTFMFYLPRICEHCLNPSCVASCPSGALYKRDEDGIVLVDQERCRGWRYCVSGCPYKKVYFNWKAGRSEKCLLCYPRVENGMPTLCAESCVGRLRHMGVLLYDADRVHEAASTKDPRAIYPALTSLFVNPKDPDVASAALADGISLKTLEAAQRSPVYKLAVEWKISFPPHPEFRTLPMVWYIPPLSPLLSVISTEGKEGAGVDRMRIPVKYLANLLTSGDEDSIRIALKKLVALRDYMRSLRIEKKEDAKTLEEAQLSPAIADEMLRLLAIAKYDDRYVLPKAKKEGSGNLPRSQGLCGFSSEKE